jgi:hypothetical protein
MVSGLGEVKDWSSGKRRLVRPTVNGAYGLKPSPLNPGLLAYVDSVVLCREGNIGGGRNEVPAIYLLITERRAAERALGGQARAISLAQVHLDPRLPQRL